jgi:hypothetical protein
MENSNIPFMFILDSEMIVKHFFVPEKGMPELTDEYLQIVKERYLNDKKDVSQLEVNEKSMPLN